MKKVELLSPAGNMESLITAIEAGCDAVYIGGKQFGAREFAGNFNDNEIIEAINYSHLYGVKVYVTVNTLIYEEEVKDFLKYIDFLHKNNIDAIIIQDIGMMDLIRKTYPNLEIHASTQMHIHNIEGVKLLEQLNIKRVVLARETSIETIKTITNNTTIEIETFIHGALCISYSGQCLMSSLIGSRSANRGSCVGSCRLKYDIVDEQGNKLSNDNYPLSLKDLNTLEYLDQILESNITSLKIEGRMKRPEYVYTVTSIYRKAIDSYYINGKTNITESDKEQLQKIYNRLFTKGFLFSEDNNLNPYRPNHMGIKIGTIIDNKKDIKIKLTKDLRINDGIRILGKEDVGFNVTKMLVDGKPVITAKQGQIVTILNKDQIQIGSEVIKTTDINQINNIKQTLKKLTRKVSITGQIIIKENDYIKLVLKDEQNIVAVQSAEKVMKAINIETTKEEIEKQISKLGNTIYQLENLDIQLDDNVFVNIKWLNEIRREAISLLNDKRLYKTNYQKNTYNIDVPNYEEDNYKTILINNINDYSNSNNYKYIYAYKDLYEKIKDDPKVVLKLERVINQYDDYNSLLLVGELGSVHKYKNVHTDFSLNVVNSYSVALLHNLGVNKITLSLELKDYQIKDIINNYKNRYQKHPNLEVIVSGYHEAMIMKTDLYSFYNVKKGNIFLKDRFNNLFLIKKRNNTYIYDHKKITKDDINKYYDMGINSIRYN